MDAEGVTLKAAMAQSSFLQDITEEKASKRTGVRNDIGAFVELHIEQGIILEKTDTR